MNLKEVFQYYRDLRPSNLKTTKYKHLLLLLFWPVFGVIFFSLERLLPIVWKAVTGKALEYQEVVCELDAQIPFCELFVIPYYFWFAFIALMIAYSILFDFHALHHCMWFIMLSYSVTVVIYLVWPNMQALRPVDIPRDNWMTDVVEGLYDFDTNTNVCPSIHVLGSLAVCFAGLHSRTLRGWGWKLFFVVSTVLISLSTVFLKQHSIIDVFAALALGAVCYVLVFFVICPEKKMAALPSGPHDC